MITVKRKFAPLTIEINTEEDLNQFKGLLYEILDKRMSRWNLPADSKYHLPQQLLEQLK